MELDVWLNDLVLQEINRAVVLLLQRHLVQVLVWNRVDAEVTCAEVVPAAVAVKLVQLGPELLSALLTELIGVVLVSRPLLLAFVDVIDFYVFKTNIILLEVLIEKFLLRSMIIFGG